MALTQTHKNWLNLTLKNPDEGGAALAALQNDYITDEEWGQLKKIRHTKTWQEVRLMLACFVMLAEDCELEV